MSKKCPNCGKEVNEQAIFCQNCGYELEKKSEFSEGSNSSEPQSDTTPGFVNKETNENIEWSELKDMSLGHVMNMFNEQTENKLAVTEANDSTEKKEKVLEKNIDETTATFKEEEFEKEEQKNSEPKSKEASPLNQYIKEHKNEFDDDVAEDITVKETIAKPLPEAEITQVEAVLPEDASLGAKETVSEEEPTALESIIEKEDSEEVPTNESEIVIPKKPTIPSKSKKPEEIEMDAAPIFFKELEEEPKVLPTTESEAKGTSTLGTHAKKNSNKKRYITLASVAILAAGGWLVYDQVQQNSNSEKKVQTEQLAEKKELAASSKETLENYFTDNSHVFIKPGMIGVSTSAIKKNIDKLKDQKDYENLIALYNLLTTKQEEISIVNKLFAQPIINGSQLNDVAIIADKTVQVKKIEEKDALDQLVNQGIDEATTQYDQLQKAKELVSVIYKENSATDNLTLANYDIAKTEVDKVKSAILRKPLTDDLEKANKILVDAQQKETEAQAANNSNNVGESTGIDYNAQISDSNTNTEASNTSSFTPPNSSGIYTEPVYTVNPSDVADMSNAAWTWAPGVKEKVIATCIERGYIIAGGYVLEPARIINGEGYYNLYGTSNQSALLAGLSEKDLPVYLVTINAQTGWFKGNASRNAGN